MLYVAGSIPNEVIGFFNLPYPSSRTMALGSTLPLTEVSVIFLTLKGDRRVRLATSPSPMRRMSRKCGASTSRYPMVLHGLLYGWLYLLPYSLSSCNNLDFMNQFPTFKQISLCKPDNKHLHPPRRTVVSLVLFIMCVNNSRHVNDIFLWMEPYIYSKDILCRHYNGILMMTLHRRLRFVPMACYLIILHGSTDRFLCCYRRREPLLKYMVGQSS
jgi:hypothetical protein